MLSRNVILVWAVVSTIFGFWMMVPTAATGPPATTAPTELSTTTMTTGVTPGMCVCQGIAKRTLPCRISLPANCLNSTSTPQRRERPRKYNLFVYSDKKEFERLVTMGRTIPYSRWMIKKAEINDRRETFDMTWANKTMQGFQNETSINYGDDVALYDLFCQYPNVFRDQTIVIPGSELPHYELLVKVVAQAKSVTTLEYRLFDVRIPGVSVTLVDDFWRRPVTFDGAMVFSNFEHDGLGRYGDPLDPDGDLKAMREVWSIVRCGGYVVLAVPSGRDCVVFNAHRVYGRQRLPLMLSGFEVIEGYPREWGSQWGTNARKRQMMNTCRHAVHAIFLLRRASDKDFDPRPSIQANIPKSWTFIREKGNTTAAMRKKAAAQAPPTPAAAAAAETD